MTRRWAAVVVVATCLVVLLAAWASRAAEGRRALSDANAALARGDAIEAILSARAAAEARCPGCGAPAAGFAKLEAIARDAEGKGDEATAFAAWRAARAAALATDASKERADADQELARLGHRLDVAQVAAGAPPTQAASEERLRAALAASEPPSAATFALVAGGGALFLFAAMRFVAGRRLAELAIAAAGAALAAAGMLLF